MSRPKGILASAFVLLMGWLLLGMSGVQQAYAAVQCPAAVRVKAAAADLMQATRSGSPEQIRRVLNRHVHMRRVMTFALGRELRKMHHAQRRRYFRQAGAYAARKLAMLARSVRGNGVEIVSCRGNRVETRLLPGGQRIVWKLRGGRIVDANFRGVWMAFMLRDHFRRMWRQAGRQPQAFLALLN